MDRIKSYGPSLIVLATALLVLLAGPFAVRELTYARTDARIIEASERLESGNVLKQLNQAYRDIAAFVEPSVVHISAQQVAEDPWGDQRTMLSTGSGWVYDSQGHIVTNFHVVENARRIEVQLDSGELREAQLVGSDEFTDIAILKIPAGRLHPATRLNVEDMKRGAVEPIGQGDLVFAFGSPFNFRFSMSQGVVSGKGRSVGVIRDRWGRPQGYENFIQVDAAINPGNSGGPLTDFRGRVIGMNTAIATGRRAAVDEGQFAGIGLAIPIEMIEPVVTQIIENGVVQKGYLGVAARAINRNALDELKKLGFNRNGVRVTEVIDGAPADNAGLEVGDIITEVNGQPIQTMEQLRAVISSMLPGEIANISIWRHNELTDESTEQTIAVELDRLDILQSMGILPEDQSTERIPELGIAAMATNTPTLARRFDAEFVEGVIITELVPNTAMEGAVPPGSVIVSVSEQRVRNVNQLLEQLRQYNLRNGVRAELVHPTGRRRTIWLRTQ